MRITILASGSSANSYLIEVNHTHLLIDAGLSFRKTKNLLLQRAGLHVEDLDGVLITHEHQDHIKGIAQFLKRTMVPIYMTMGTASALNLMNNKRVKKITVLSSIKIGDFLVLPVPIMHDAIEPVGYVLNSSKGKFAFITDLGGIYEETIEALKDINGMVLEFNHDKKLLMSGPYPYHLKQRIVSANGHLSNDESIQLLNIIDVFDLQLLIAGHLSEQNNDPQLVKKLLQKHYPNIKSVIATRNGLETPLTIGRKPRAYQPRL